MTVKSSLHAAQTPDPVIATLSAIEDSNARIEEIARSLHKSLTLKPALTSHPTISSEDRERAVRATSEKDTLSNQDSRLSDAVFSLHSIPQIS